jgi:hypothetical protein
MLDGNTYIVEGGWIQEVVVGFMFDDTIYCGRMSLSLFPNSLMPGYGLSVVLCGGTTGTEG